MDVEERNGTFYLSGRLDEYASFDTLLNSNDPVKINVGKITSINSIGIRKFLAFTIQWAPKKMEFYECTSDFIANVNVVPQMLGGSNDVSQIKSYYVPYYCEACKSVVNQLYKAGDIQVNAQNEVEVPKIKCSKCDDEPAMDMDVDEAEYFLWLYRED